MNNAAGCIGGEAGCLGLPDWNRDATGAAHLPVPTQLTASSRSRLVLVGDASPVVTARAIVPRLWQAELDPDRLLDRQEVRA